MAYIDAPRQTALFLHVAVMLQYATMRKTVQRVKNLWLELMNHMPGSGIEKGFGTRKGVKMHNCTRGNYEQFD